MQDLPQGYLDYLAEIDWPASKGTTPAVAGPDASGTPPAPVRRWWRNRAGRGQPGWEIRLASRWAWSTTAPVTCTT